MQKKTVISVQERKPTKEIAESLDVKRKTVYRILKGLSGDNNVPYKYQCDTEYVRKLPQDAGWNQKLRLCYTLTPEGLMLIDDISISVESSKYRELDECRLCGFEDADCLHEHHIIPRSRGGSDDESNIIILCANCHAKVHRLILDGIHPELALEKVSGQKVSALKEAMNRDGN